MAEAAEVEAPETQEVVQQEELTQDNQKEFDPKKDWIDDKEIDPRIKAKMDHFYKEMKKHQKESREWRRIDQERQQKIIELEQATHVVVDHLTEKSLSDSEAQLNKQMKQALESGDNDGYLEAQDKLLNIKAQKIAKLNTKKQQPQKQERPLTTREAVDEGVAGGELTSEEASYAKAWINEAGDNGEPLRPWANNDDPEDPDPDFVKAATIAQSLFTKPAYQNWTVEKKLAEIDRRMGLTKQQPKQTVMGGGLTRKTPNVKVSLTPKQREIAIATKFGGPNAKSEADHITAYEKAVLKSKGATK